MRRGARGGWLLLAGLSAGCGLFQRRPPAPPPVVIPQPPIIFQVMPAGEAPAAPPASLFPLPSPPLPALAVPVAGPPPPPPRRGDSEAARGGAHPPPPPPDARAADAGPQLTASLSPAQQAAYRRDTQSRLQQTQRALKLLYARRDLSAEALATRAQAAEYVRQAQAALAQGDLVRAQTLAVKAQTLAQFLLGRG